MAFAFDTLGFTKHLQRRREPAAGRSRRREFIMNELVTETDLLLALDNMKSALTIRLGGMIAAGAAALAVLQRLH